MSKKIILISMCLIFLFSCGRKNDPKFEASLNNETKIFIDSKKFFVISNKNELYQ
tara:strand:- start:250 stop:414 length:165 start_codon:yes stop_codon:yes gene_type:complete